MLSFPRDATTRKLPENVRVMEFYMRSGTELHNAHAGALELEA